MADGGSRSLLAVCLQRADPQEFTEFLRASEN